MNWFIFTLGVLFVYRLSGMFAREEGPAGVFKKARREVPANTNAGRGVRCPFCWSVWIAFALTGYLWWLEQVGPWFTPVYAIALSGGAYLLHRLDGAD